MSSHDLSIILADYTRRGYRIISQTEYTAQVERPKRINPLGAVMLVLLPLLCGVLAYTPAFLVMLIGVVIVGLDYALKKPHIEYIDVRQID